MGLAIATELNSFMIHSLELTHFFSVCVLEILSVQLKHTKEPQNHLIHYHYYEILVCSNILDCFIVIPLIFPEILERWADVYIADTLQGELEGLMSHYSCRL